jgi:hypothetical protein
MSDSRDSDMLNASFGDQVDQSMDNGDRNCDTLGRSETQIQNSGLAQKGVTKIEDGFGAPVQLNHHQNVINYQYSTTSLNNMFSHTMNLKDQSESN